MKDSLPERPAGLHLHRRRRAVADQLPARRRLQRDARRTPARSATSCRARRLLGLGDRAQRLGPAERHVQRRQPGVEHRRRRRARRSPAPSRTASDGPDRGREGRAPERPAGLLVHRRRRALAVRASQLDDDSDGTLSNTPHVHRRDARAAATRSPRPCPAAGTRPPRPATTAARCRTSTSPPARPSPAPSRTASAGRSWWSQDASPTTRRTSRSRPAAACHPPASRSTTTPTRTLLEHAHVQRRAGRRRLLARGDRARRLGPGERHLQRRQPGVEHRRRPPARRSPARSRTTSAARSWS